MKTPDKIIIIAARESVTANRGVAKAFKTFDFSGDWHSKVFPERNKDLIFAEYVQDVAYFDENDPDRNVFFSEELAGSEGISVLLFREPHHTDADIEEAKDWLRKRRDVVKFRTFAVTEWLIPE